MYVTSVDVKNRHEIRCATESRQFIRLLDYEPAWIDCDHNAWKLVGIISVCATTMVMASLLVFYLRWDIRFWIAVKQVKRNQANRVLDEGQEEVRLLQDVYDGFVSYCNEDWDLVRDVSVYLWTTVILTAHKY